MHPIYSTGVYMNKNLALLNGCYTFIEKKKSDNTIKIINFLVTQNNAVAILKGKQIGIQADSIANRLTVKSLIR